MIHATTWINLKNTFSEKSQIQKTTYGIVHLHEMSRKDKLVVA